MTSGIAKLKSARKNVSQKRMDRCGQNDRFTSLHADYCPTGSCSGIPSLLFLVGEILGDCKLLVVDGSPSLHSGINSHQVIFTRTTAHHAPPISFFSVIPSPNAGAKANPAKAGAGAKGKAAAAKGKGKSKKR